MKLAATVMIQGTASSVGKSMMTAALCRLYHERGLRVAPFKAQNMALNSFVTAGGEEIGRAQASQAEAAGVLPTVDMNPVLLKPEGDRQSQVIVQGKAIGRMSAVAYHELKPQLRGVIADSLQRLRASYDVVVIEGAGSPAEINLKAGDIVNMFVARLAPSPVLLVGDIDRGGVFAAFAGTMALLEADERALVAGLIVNKFRGDLALLTPGLDFISQYTGVPVLGVIPHVDRLRLAEEDSLGLEPRLAKWVQGGRGDVQIGIVRLPRLSNYDEFDALEHMPGVALNYVDDPQQVADLDLLILPGSKQTIADLAWLRASGMAAAVLKRIASERPVLGICGGCQMLGQSIDDPVGVETSGERVKGLGVLPIATRFERRKMLAQVEAVMHAESFASDAGGASGVKLVGYEIHAGIPHLIADLVPAHAVGHVFTITMRGGEDVAVADGFLSANGAAVGTMIHGLFDVDSWRQQIVARLRARRGEAALDPALVQVPSRTSEYARLAGVLRSHLEMAALDRIVFGRELPCRP